MEGSSVLIEVSFKDISATWELVLLSLPSFVLSYGSKCAGELNLHAVIFVLIQRWLLLDGLVQNDFLLTF